MKIATKLILRDGKWVENPERLSAHEIISNRTVYIEIRGARALDFYKSLPIERELEGDK